jgi:hypothetical protein
VCAATNSIWEFRGKIWSTYIESMSNQRTEKRRTDKRRTDKKQGGKKRRTQKRRTEKKRAGKRHHCENNITMHSLQKWYDNAFKNLGWMVLAKQRGNMEDKILVYKNSIRRLMGKIECKLHSITDHDSKEDLKIMWENAKVLREHADKDF